MISSVFQHRRVRPAVILAGLLTFASSALATATAAESAVLDDFSSSERTSAGSPRVLVDDKAAGSQSSATQTYANGVATVKGSLVPGRGAPAFISFVLLATPDAKPRDLSAYAGVRLRIKVNSGMISVQAGSSEITNYDYHTGAVVVRGTETQEVRIAFKDLKRVWSDQTALNLKTITSINLVAFGMAKGEFSYEIDEIGFY